MANLLKRRRQLMEMLIAERNRLSWADEKIQPGIKEHIKLLKQALSDINTDLEKRIQASHAWREKDNLLKSVPGIG